MKTRTIIKICGMKNKKDILHANTLDIDYVGMIFSPNSPRHINVDSAVELSGLKLDKKIVGVFMDQSKEYITEIINSINLDLLQFHGSEDYEFCKSFNLPYIKTIHIKDSSLNYEPIVIENASHVLFDNQEKEVRGGTGKSFDWSILNSDHKIKDIISSKSCLIAGGLSLENIDDLLLTYNPYGLDVSSGLECSIGNKDHNLMTQFVQRVREYDKEI